MATSLSENVPLLSAPAGAAQSHTRVPSAQLSGQPGSPRACAPPPDEFVVHLDDPKLGSHPRETFGYLLMFCSAFCYGTMQLVIRLATGYNAFAPASVSVLLGVATASFALGSILTSSEARARIARTERTDLPLVALRGFLGGTGMFLIIVSLGMIPLGTQTSLYCLCPIFAVAMSSVILGEEFGACEMVAAVLSFVGIGFVGNPTLQIDLSALRSSSYLYGCVIAVMSGWVIAGAYVTVKSLGKRVHYMLSVLSVGIWSFLVGVAMGGADPRLLFENPMQTAFVAVGCIFGVMSQCFLNKGFQYCRAGTGAMIRNADVPISYLFGVLFLEEIPNYVSLFGSTLVTVGTVLVSSNELLGRGRR